MCVLAAEKTIFALKCFIFFKEQEQLLMIKNTHYAAVAKIYLILCQAVFLVLNDYRYVFPFTHFI